MEPLNDCICSINRVSEALVAADVHPITGHCSNYDYIRQEIVQARWSLQHSDQAATACLRCLDESLETLTQDEGTLERQKNAAQRSLGDLRTKQASNEKLLEESLGALEQARTNLRSTRETLESQERRVQTAKTVGRVGLGLSVIPFVGWVVGKNFNQVFKDSNSNILVILYSCIFDGFRSKFSMTRRTQNRSF